MARKNKKNNIPWFSSTFVVLLIAFIIFSGIAFWRYDWEVVLDQYLFYIIGASFTGIVIFIIGYFYKKRKINFW